MSWYRPADVGHAVRGQLADDLGNAYARLEFLAGKLDEFGPDGVGVAEPGVLGLDRRLVSSFGGAGSQPAEGPTASAVVRADTPIRLQGALRHPRSSSPRRRRRGFGCPAWRLGDKLAEPRADGKLAMAPASDFAFDGSGCTSISRPSAPAAAGTWTRRRVLTTRRLG